MLPSSRLHPPIAATLGDVVTERLALRRFLPEDLDGLAAVFARPEVWRFPYGRAFDRAETAPFLRNRLDEWDACRFGLWIAVERETDRIIGFVGLSVPTFLPEVLPAVEVGWRSRRRRCRCPPSPRSGTRRPAASVSGSACDWRGASRSPPTTVEARSKLCSTR